MVDLRLAEEWLTSGGQMAKGSACGCLLHLTASSRPWGLAWSARACATAHGAQWHGDGTRATVRAQWHVRPPTAHNEVELRQKSEELEAQVAHMSTAEAKLRQKNEELEAQVAHTSAKEAELRQQYEKLAEELAEAQKEGEGD